MNKCYNNAIVKGSRSAGGIVGGLYIGALRIWNCGVSSNTQIIGENYSGGILGEHQNYGTNYIYNSYVLGNISGTVYVGGISGNTYSRNATPSGKTKIDNSYFAGTIEGGKKVGGIVGYSNNYDVENELSFLNCYYLNTIPKAISNVEKDGITALSQEDMKEKDTLLLYLQNYTNTENELLVWSKDENQYPKLTIDKK